MSEREEYPAGVPCWVDVLAPEPEALLGFYRGLFGWEFSGPGPGNYFVARLHGRDVAGIGQAQAVPAWNTYVRVASADEAAARAVAGGGTVPVGPFDVAPAGRLAVVVDPTGAALCLWEAGDREGAQIVNDPGTWTMSSLHTADGDAATAFYGELFGWETMAFGPAVLFRLPGYVGGEELQPVPRDVIAAMAPPSDEIPPHWNVNLRVGSVDATADQAAALGGTVIMAPFDTPGFRNALLADPQGAVFSISELAESP
jgi:predicted enzyme related to lactoylglutathione lyase